MKSKSQINFIGKGPCSKSLLNRAWIIKSYIPDFQIKGSSTCDDAQIIEKAVKSLHQGEEIFCGKSATAFRFMALRASRIKGTHVLTGDKQLFSRPHQHLFQVLSQLGVSFEEQPCRLVLHSSGWMPQGDALTIPAHISSQFASAVFLNGWNLKKDLFISLEGKPVSPSYLQMTLSFLKNIGIHIEGNLNEFKIPRQQQVLTNSYEMEPDMSCLFTLACFATLNGTTVFTPWYENSIQPDSIFPQILQKMGALIENKNSTLKVSSNPPLQPISVNLNSHPDMFPSLAILCSLSKGVSTLKGLNHLPYKESNRLEQTVSLLKAIHCPVTVKDNEIEIEGQPNKYIENKIIFDTKEDHRMAMAAALLSYAGFNIEIKNRDCTSKSFPDFWSIVNL